MHEMKNLTMISNIYSKKEVKKQSLINIDHENIFVVKLYFVTIVTKHIYHLTTTFR